MDQTYALALIPSVELRQSIPSQIAAISHLIGQVMHFIRSVRTADGSEADIELSLQEAVANAVIHGNGEDVRKRVYVVCRCSMNGEVSITIRDQGNGFDNRAIPDPTIPENHLST